MDVRSWKPEEQWNIYLALKETAHKMSKETKQNRDYQMWCNLKDQTLLGYDDFKVWYADMEAVAMNKAEESLWT